MWADFKKTNETEIKVFYDYGFESHELTGKIEYDKGTKKINITKLSEKDDVDNVNIFTKQWFYKLIKESFPDERMVAIG